MNKQSRRSFFAAAATIGVTSTASAIPFMKEEKKQLVHHVYFWLKNKNSEEDRNKLISGLNSLKQIQQLRLAKIGIPASTEKRDVIDDSYSISWLNFFDDVQAEQEYQVHPIHVKFVEEHKHLWEKVVVYDSLDI